MFVKVLTHDIWRDTTYLLIMLTTDNTKTLYNYKICILQEVKLKSE